MMPLDFDVEEELRTEQCKPITEDTLRSTRGVLPWVLTILEKLGAPGLIIQERMTACFVTYGTRDSDGSVYLPLAGEYLQEPRGVFQVKIPGVTTFQYPLGFPTMEFLRTLPDDYFGKPIEFERSEGFTIPFSLERDGDKLYVRTHMTEEECRRRVTESSR